MNISHFLENFETKNFSRKTAVFCMCMEKLRKFSLHVEIFLVEKELPVLCVRFTKTEVPVQKQKAKTVKGGRK